MAFEALPRHQHRLRQRFLLVRLADAFRRLVVLLLLGWPSRLRPWCLLLRSLLHRGFAANLLLQPRQ